MMRVESMNPFEGRNGPQVRVAQGEEGAGDGEEGAEAIPNLVLIVMDANKEVSTHALDWARNHVVQTGDSVKLLGVLHHIVNPMGYKSRADEKSWNGANRKVLEAAIEAHLMMYKRIPNVYENFHKLGAKLEIEVRAHIHPKNLVVEEANKLSARYVVIDRHIKKDKKYYIENLTCYVTRVKTFTNYEHLRHGVPKPELDMVATVEVPAVETPPAPAQMPAAQESMPPTRMFQQRQQQALGPPSPTSEFMSGVRSGDYNPYNDSLTSSAGAALPGEYIYGSQGQRQALRASAHRAQAGLDMNTDGAMREHAVRQWLKDSSHGVDPAFASRMSELGRMAIGYPGNSFMHHTPPPPSPVVTEEVLAEYMSNLCYQGMQRSALPPTQGRKANYSPNTDRTASRYLPFKSSQSRTNSKSAHLPTKAASFSSGAATESAVAEWRSLDSNTSRSSGPAPISVQPRRAADASWALDLLGVGNPEVQALSMPREATPATTGRKDPPEVITHSSSVRRAVSSKKQAPGAPPLCSVCKQQLPDFGKVKRFTFSELQVATNNFSVEHYMAEGAYGSVYKGQLMEGQLVAVKQHKLKGSQTDEEFAAEVEALSCAQHRNLVTLIGYCVENKLRLLVYEFICNGSLDRHLSPKSKTELKWKDRFKIALGAARALRYLHEECRVGCIIHRDMRPNNILLTHDFTPLVGDFGLARRQPSGDKAEETRVLGTIGYLAPEYAETGKITDKADVYAFGVVLLELITGRKAIEIKRSRDQIILTEWARPLLVSYDKQLVDPRLRNNFDEYEMHCMMHAANQCIKKDPSMRPRMVQVLRILNPPEESDWTYARGKTAPMFAASDGEHSQDLSSRGSLGGSCSQSDASLGSYSDASDTDSLPQQPTPTHSRLSKAKSGSKSLWRTFTCDKLSRDDSFRDIAAVNRMSCDGM